MKRVIATLVLAGLLPAVVYLSCSKDEELPNRRLKTENVVIIVMDGPRYAETWGQIGHPNIPRMANDMAPEGVVFTNFRNNGRTNTTNGHAAITTGFYQNVNNSGQQLPAKPSIFQQYIKAKGVADDKVWIVTSKDKLQVLANSSDANWNDEFLARTDCGVNGLNTGYRHDSITFRRSMEVLEEHKPSFMLINFREPDYSGHANHWKNYIKGIQMIDEYSYQIWNYLQNDPHYRDNTTFILTNDHGRHTEGVSVGFVSHGCQCDGCTHINLYASGPDFPKGTIVDKEYELVDINTTIRGLLQINKDVTQGKMITELVQ